MTPSLPPGFRFAPSPNGALHLGHAYSALLNQQAAQQCGGSLLLRIEDIDTTRCTTQLEIQMLEDLNWLGVKWDAEPRRQSQHFREYAKTLTKLRKADLVYPAFMSRAEIRKSVADKKNWPHDPDGQPHYPGIEKALSPSELAILIEENPVHSWRLNMQMALQRLDRKLTWFEHDREPVEADPAVWGDIVLARSDTPTSYHLSVVTDDALQGITNIVRGKDLYNATSIHRLLQELLGLPEPVYHHHDLILAKNGHKLSKSSKDTSLRSLQNAGLSPDDIKHMVGL